MGCCPACSWQIDYFGSSPHSEGYWLCVTAADTFSGYGVAVPVQSVDSSHTTLVLESNLCQVFGFLDHLV